MNNSIKPRKLTTVMYLLPGLIIYTFTVFLPILGALYYSFFNWAGGTKMTFTGLENYIRLLKDNVFWQSFGNNIFLTVFSLMAQIGIAFFFAMLLNTKAVKFKGLHRTLGYFPVTISAVIVGYIWSLIYDYNYGLLNYFLNALGQREAVQPWLTNPKYVMILVTIPLIWQYIGFYLVIILSSMSGIDPQIFEMSEIDGANGWKKAIYITLPLIKNAIVVSVMLCVSGSMKVFDHIYVMTGGGPGTSSSVVAMYAYNTSFKRHQMGYGSTLSIGILVLSLVVTVLSRWIVSRAGGRENKR
ncbi:MAG: sugar ABC transporter permease [Oscillospiraceae bacterium]